LSLRAKLANHVVIDGRRGEDRRRVLHQDATLEPHHPEGAHAGLLPVQRLREPDGRIMST